MSDTSYPKGMEKLLSGQIDLDSDTIMACLLPDTYTYSAAHEYLSQLGTRVGTDQALTNLSVADGRFSADNLDFGAVSGGQVLRSLVIYKSTGNPSTSPVLIRFDSLRGFPRPANGGVITVPFDDTARRIARIAEPMYRHGASLLLGGQINLLTDDIQAVLVPAGYVREETHMYLSDLPAPIAALSLTNKSVANGVFDADDADYGVLAQGPTVGGYALVKNTGLPETSPLLMYVAPSGFPYELPGTGFKLTWPNVASRIFSLTPV